MTPAAALLDRLRQAGATVSLRPDGKLSLQPARVLTPELLAEAKGHRDELVALLASPPPRDDPAPEPRPTSLSGAERERIARQTDRELERENRATMERLFGDASPPPAAVIETAPQGPPRPSEAEIEARGDALLAEAQANPAVRITDEAKAAEYFHSRAIADAINGAKQRPHAQLPKSTPPALGALPLWEPPITEPHDGSDAEAEEHLSQLSAAMSIAFTGNLDGSVEVRTRQDGGSWSAPLPPRFEARPSWWSAERTGWCTGCAAPSTWRADPHAPSAIVLHWRCIRCGPEREASGNAAA
jgi:hypothetical protein